MKKIKFNLSKYSEENLQKILRFVKIIINQIEIDGINKSKHIIVIPFEIFKKDNFGYEEILTMIKVLNKITNTKIVIEVLNETVNNISRTIEDVMAEREKKGGILEIQEEEKERIRSEWLKYDNYDGILRRNDLKNKLVIKLKKGINSDFFNQIKQVVRERLEKTDIKEPKELFIENNDEGITFEEILSKNNFGEEHSKMRDRQHQERLQRENSKQQRILNCKEDKRVHALNTIIEHIESSRSKQKNISIDYYNFNYESRMDASKIFKYFLEQIKKEKCIKDYSRPCGGTRFSFIGVNVNKLKEFRGKLEKEIKEKDINENKSDIKKELSEEKNVLESIYLITESLEPKSVIFLVFNEIYKMPIRFSVNNCKGNATYIKKLYDIAYICNAPDKKVYYEKYLADNINNALFRKRSIKRYMTTNNFRKPTLVQKSEDKKILVLKNEIQVKTILIKNIPSQYQYLYKDKTM